MGDWSDSLPPTENLVWENRVHTSYLSQVLAVAGGPPFGARPTPAYPGDPGELRGGVQGKAGQGLCLPVQHHAGIAREL